MTGPTAFDVAGAVIWPIWTLLQIAALAWLSKSISGADSQRGMVVGLACTTATAAASVYCLARLWGYRA